MRVVSLDLMAGMLREARTARGHLASRPRLVQADAQALPLTGHRFDRVFCCGVLYHVPNCGQALREMRRVLRPGGRAAIATNGAYAIGRIYGRAEQQPSVSHTPTPRLRRLIPSIDGHLPTVVALDARRGTNRGKQVREPAYHPWTDAWDRWRDARCMRRSDTESREQPDNAGGRSNHGTTHQLVWRGLRTDHDNCRGCRTNDERDWKSYRAALRDAAPARDAELERRRRGPRFVHAS